MVTMPGDDAPNDQRDNRPNTQDKAAKQDHEENPVHDSPQSIAPPTQHTAHDGGEHPGWPSREAPSLKAGWCPLTPMCERVATWASSGDSSWVSAGAWTDGSSVQSEGG